jgi:transcriptional regulator with XRE-family HTH domain
MATKDRAVDLGTQRGRRILGDLGREVRQARVEHGLSQTAVAAAARTSRAQVSRVERAQAPRVSVPELSRLLAVVGLELSARAYPAGPPVRDAAHRALLDRFRARVAPSVAWRFEVPVGRAGDLRAWDAVMLVESIEVAVEAETRPRDVQALQRRLAAKRRDDPGVSSVVLLLANTRHNRTLMKEQEAALRADLPLPAQSMLRALAEGRDPGGSGVVLV